MPKRKPPVQKKVKELLIGTPDEAWFLARMKTCGVYRWELYRALNPEVTDAEWNRLTKKQQTSRSNIIRQLRIGERDVKINEAAILARMLDVPYLEIVRRLGVEAPDITVPVTGTVHAHGRVTVRTPDKIYRVPAPPGVGPTAVAIVVEGAHTALAIFDGSHLFYEPTAGVAVDAFDRLAVVELADHGKEPIVGRLTRGAPRHVRVITLGDIEPIESEQLVGAWPILWQQMG